MLTSTFHMHVSLSRASQDSDMEDVLLAVKLLCGGVIETGTYKTRV